MKLTETATLKLKLSKLYSEFSATAPKEARVIKGKHYMEAMNCLDRIERAISENRTV